MSVTMAQEHRISGIQDMVHDPLRAMGIDIGHAVELKRHEGSIAVHVTKTSQIQKSKHSLVFLLEITAHHPLTAP
jgi:hypothetical protein